MWRFIFLALVVALIVYLFKRQTIQSGSANPDLNNSANKRDNSYIEDMVQCTQCAVHLPRSEAYLVAGEFYCSKEHIKKS